jgi:putative DNA primase/helicase
MKKVRKLRSYTELSPSNQGIRVITIGILPVGGRKKGDIECYDSDKYVTLTGHHLEGTPRTIEARYDEIIEIHREIFGDGRQAHKAKERQPSPVSLDDEALLNKAWASANGASFSKLFEGHWEDDYPSQSEADMALCHHLSFWCGRDAARVDALFRQSGLYRAKWDKKHHSSGASYGQETVRRAIENTTKIYTGHGGEEIPHSEHSEERQNTPEADPTARILVALAQNEDGDAALFIDMNFGKFAYDAGEGRWYHFDGNHWSPDTTNEVMAALEGVVGAYSDEAARQSDLVREATLKGDKNAEKIHQKRYDALLRRMRDLRSKRRKRDVIELASINWSAWRNRSLALKGDEWDSDPRFLGCANGVIDLNTGDFRQGRPSDYIRTWTPTSWNGLDAPAKRWEQCLHEVFDSNTELVNYLRRLLGYTISGEVLDRIFPIFHGARGQNGKGTILEALGYVLGPLAGPVESEMLLLQKFYRHSGAPTSDLMSLRGKRLVWASETAEGGRLNAGRVKSLNGGDTIVGRYPYAKQQTTFKPTHTLFLLTNYRPHVSATDHAFWARVHLIPFLLSFVDDPHETYQRKRDLKLQKKLRAEAPGILASLVRGCLLWRAQGLNPPAIVQDATRSYRDDEDIIGAFIKDRCVVEANREVQAGILYAAYKEWSANMGMGETNQMQFGIDIKERFDSRSDTHTRRIYYLGLDLCGDKDE